MIIEIPLYIFGYIGWFSLLIGLGFLSYHGIKIGGLAFASPFLFCLVLFLCTGLVIGCNTVWSCPIEVRIT